MSLEQLHLLPLAEQQAILNGPALKPPDGIDYNFENPPNHNVLGYTMIGLSIFVIALALCIRGYARIVVIKKISVEDYMALFGFVFYMAYQGLVLNFTVAHGFMVHQWDIQVKTMSSFLYMVYIVGVLYPFMVCPIKVAILREWCRVFVPYPTRNTFWWVCQAVIGLNVLFYCTGPFVGNLSCIPREKIWDKTIPGGHCIDVKLSDLTSAAINLISDIIILVLPQRVIWKLNMPLEQKLGTAIVFAVGLVCCGAAAARLHYGIDRLRAPDATYAASIFSLCITAETTCMYLVFCFPAFPKAFNRNVPVSRIFKSWSKISNKPTSDSSAWKNEQEASAGKAPSSSFSRGKDSGIGGRGVAAGGGGDSEENIMAAIAATGGGGRGGDVSDTEAQQLHHQDSIPLRSVYVSRGGGDPYGEEEDNDDQRRRVGAFNMENGAIVQTTVFNSHVERATPDQATRHSTLAEKHHQHPWEMVVTPPPPPPQGETGIGRAS